MENFPFSKQKVLNLNNNSIIFLTRNSSSQNILISKIKWLLVASRIVTEDELRKRIDLVQSIRKRGLSLSKEIAYQIKWNEIEKLYQLIISQKYLECSNFKSYLTAKSIQTSIFPPESTLILFYDLLDLALKQIGSNNLIFSLQNVLITAHQHQQVYLNMSSMSGWQLLFFNQPISGQEFQQIYLSMDSQIFNRPPSDRINSKTIQRGIAAILLSLIMSRPIELPEVSKEATISKQQAAVEVSQTKQRMRKFLTLIKVKEMISSFQNTAGMKLYDLLYAVFVFEKDLTWREFMFLVIPTSISEVKHNMSEIIAQQQWKSLSTYQKSFLIGRKIVAVDEQSGELNKEDYSFFAFYLTGTKFSTLTKYKNIEGFFSDSQNFSDFTTDFLTKMTNLLIPINKNSSPKMKQKKHISVNDKDTQEYSKNLKQNSWSATDKTNLICDIYKKKSKLQVKRNEGESIKFASHQLQTLNKFTSKLR